MGSYSHAAFCKEDIDVDGAVGVFFGIFFPRSCLGLFLFSNVCLHLALSLYVWNSTLQLNFTNRKYSVYICILDVYSLFSVISGFSQLPNLHALNDQ